MQVAILSAWQQQQQLHNQTLLIAPQHQLTDAKLVK